jgi:hypothetical protein
MEIGKFSMLMNDLQSGLLTGFDEKFEEILKRKGKVVGNDAGELFDSLKEYEVDLEPLVKVVMAKFNEK